MAGFTIILSADRKTVTLSVKGHFDLSHGFALWQYCEPDRNRHENYIIDLADVTDMRDSGIGWLIMFCPVGPAERRACVHGPCAPGDGLPIIGGRDYSQP